MVFLRDNREAVTVSYVDKNDLLRLILSTGVFSGTEKPGTCGGHHQEPAEFVGVGIICGME